MKITEALKSLENSWSRKDVLVKIKNGEDSEKILNDFFNNKQNEIETLTNFIDQKDKVLISQMENLSHIESKLFNKINNYKSNKREFLKIKNKEEKVLQPNQQKLFNLSLFMMQWSNKFVFIILLVISAIALTKQAWA